MRIGSGLSISVIAWVIASVIGCSDSSGGGDSGGGGLTPTMQGPPETPYCSTILTYSSPVTITGTANYNQRRAFGNELSGGLGSASPTDPTHPAATNPIRYAEVRVTNSSGAVIQCATTDVNGGFSFNLPQGNVSYTVAINSRSNNSHLYASILDSPDHNQFYSLTTSVFATASASVGTLTAQANGDLLAGPFNILDQILNANLFLVTKVGTCGSTFTGCKSYDPTLHKIAAYWKKGFNPNDYFGAGGGGLSFYLPGYSRLFILGGVNGDTDNSDTDHFDNSVIIHEYGHFLEDNWLKTDSPGGQHDGNELLDPRLAWSEGWGDFIQAAVRADNHYIDTIGNVDGTTNMAFYVDTETATSGTDFPNYPGEGNFREFAITRTLWDIVDTNADSMNLDGSLWTDNISDKFIEIWAGLSKSTYGYLDPSFTFRNVGLLHLAETYMQVHPVGADAAASDWTQVRGLNRQSANESHYAQYLVPSSTGSGWTAATCSAAATTPTHNMGVNYFFSITPATVGGDTGSLSTSDLFQNNRFYRLHIDGAHAGAHTLVLSYQDDDNAGTLADLDLYVYNKSAQFAVSSDWVGYSQSTPSGGVGVVQNETAHLSLGAGDYLVDVNVYTGGGASTKADYNLTIDGVVLCPGNLVPP